MWLYSIIYAVINLDADLTQYPSADDSFPPRTAVWRCNLTALSQRRNLLFVAYSQQIYVWEPAGASQTLGSKPEMIINPVMKEVHGTGYIQPDFPHEINSILVDDLGREEVLLLVTDSGNVCGYRVDAIFSALKRAAGSGKPRPLDGTEVDPFFLEYVGASAWGLAIHKFARLIAVTANTGLVTVFAFALVNLTSGTSDDALSQLEEDGEFTDCGQTWLDIRTGEQFNQLRNLMPEKHRTRNIRLTYTGHFSNIPSVSFLNCDLDPNGTWMVSTDIDNKVLVWKVWETLGPFNIYYFNEVTFRAFPNTLRNDDRGWSVIALDPRSFHLLDSTEEACGGQPQRRMKDGQAILDLTKLSNRIPDASRLYNYFPPAVKGEPEEAVLPDIFGADCLIGGDNSAQEKRDSRVTNTSAVTGSLRPSDSADAFSHQAVDGSIRADEVSEPNGSETDHDPETQVATSHHELLQALIESDDPSNAIPPGHRPLTTPEFLQYALLEALGGDVHEVEALLGENLTRDPDDEDHHFRDQIMDDIDIDPFDSDGISEAGLPAYQVFDPPANANFPILHFSHTDIRLIPHPFAPSPSVVCGAPLQQPFTNPIVSIRNFDRFNMVKYIPEHGIVVAASQKGRAAVIALTESRATGRSFRVDWIVPLESQEKYGERPLVPLLGMTVSPMQGFEIPPDVQHIPHDSKDATDALQFHFQYKDTNNPSPPSSTSNNTSSSTTSYYHHPNNTNINTIHPNPQRPPTLPECHARATRTYQPEESWRGWNPSRRYRLLLIYTDHTVMSYEFWYTWNFSSVEVFSSGGVGDGDGDDDDYLVL
ncbi:hypothetical protein BDW59DRAFT_51469 [Aspergillus cavernicola]|uniref:Uncharacterized protein n=1 Tax=Aspergillus cavernicola TaxID=176166 RepID=A0ABR4IKC1_9EURO